MLKHFKSPIETLKQRVSAIASRAQTIKAEIAGLIPPMIMERADTLLKGADQAVALIEATGQQAPEAFDRLAERQIEAGKALRAFVYANNIKRPVYAPDHAKTFATIIFMLLLDASIITALMVADGKVGLVTGAAYGFSIAGLHSLWGLVTGYYVLRYVGYRAGSRAPKLQHALVRMTAWLGFAGALAVSAFIMFAAARMRATGDAAGIFDYTALSPLATFGDYYAIAICLIGAIGTLIAWHKGYGGVEDPIPGYQRLSQAANADIDEEAEELLDETTGQIEDAAEDAIEALEDGLADLADEQSAYRDGITKATADIAALNTDVEIAVERVKEAARVEAIRRSYIEGREVAPVVPDLSALMALRIDPETVPGLTEKTENPIPDARSHVARIEAAAQAAIQAVRLAHMAFRARTNPPIPFDL